MLCFLFKGPCWPCTDLPPPLIRERVNYYNSKLILIIGERLSFKRRHVTSFPLKILVYILSKSEHFAGFLIQLIKVEHYLICVHCFLSSKEKTHSFKFAEINLFHFSFLCLNFQKSSKLFFISADQ